MMYAFSIVWKSDKLLEGWRGEKAVGLNGPMFSLHIYANKIKLHDIKLHTLAIAADVKFYGIQNL